MKHRDLDDQRRDDHAPRGSYPPDVARQRRRHGLPVTPEEHAAYARGELPEPPVTRTQIAATLRAAAATVRDVMPRIPPGSPFRAALDDILSRIEAARAREPGED